MNRTATYLLYAWLWLGWFACVLLGRHGLGWAGLGFPAVGWLLFLKIYHPRAEDGFKLLTLAVTGMIADLMAQKLHLIHLTAGVDADFFPLWLVALWLLFAPVFALLQKPLGARLPLAALLGAVFGPLSYSSGEFFKVLEFNGAAAFAAYAVFWALFLPLGIYWLRKPAVTS